MAKLARGLAIGLGQGLNNIANRIDRKNLLEAQLNEKRRNERIQLFYQAAPNMTHEQIEKAGSEFGWSEATIEAAKQLSQVGKEKDVDFNQLMKAFNLSKGVSGFYQDLTPEEQTRFQENPLSKFIYGMKKDNDLELKSDIDQLNNFYNKMSGAEKSRFKQDNPELVPYLYEYKPPAPRSSLTPAEKKNNEQVRFIDKALQVLGSDPNVKKEIDPLLAQSGIEEPEEVKKKRTLYQELLSLRAELGSDPEFFYKQQKYNKIVKQFQDLMKKEEKSTNKWDRYKEVQ